MKEDRQTGTQQEDTAPETKNKDPGNRNRTKETTGHTDQDEDKQPRSWKHQLEAPKQKIYRTQEGCDIHRT